MDRMMKTRTSSKNWILPSSAITGAKSSAENHLGRRWCFVLVLTFGLLFVVFVGLNGSYGNRLSFFEPAPQERYVVIIDAGSTGTRIYVFRYGVDDPSMHLTAIPPEAAIDDVPYRPGNRAFNRVETLPGLQTLTRETLQRNDTSKLINEIRTKALEPLLNWARRVVPKNRRSQTPLCLMATAGVRGMSSDSQEQLIDALTRILTHSDFKSQTTQHRTFLFPKNGIEIMSGHQEGILGWVALNHNIGTFNASTPSVPPPSSIADMSTAPASVLSMSETNKTSTSIQSLMRSNGIGEGGEVGALDLGGSSLELTVPSDHASSTGLVILKRMYRLESKSFEGMGLNSAYQTSLWRLAMKSAAFQKNKTVELEHPCAHDGYTDHVTLHPRRNATGGKPEPKKAIVIGVPSWSRCLELTRDVVEAPGNCENFSCINAPVESLKKMRFVGLNGFYVVWHFFRLGAYNTLANLEQRGEEFCNRSWASVQSELRDVVDVDRFCFRSAYVSWLLQKIFGFERDDSFYVASETISWPIGAALMQVQSQLPRMKQFSRRFGSGRKRPPPWSSIAITGIGVLGVATVTVAFLRAFRGRRDRTPHDRSLLSGGRSPPIFSTRHRVNEIKRRNFSYRRLHNLSIPEKEDR